MNHRFQCQLYNRKKKIPKHTIHGRRNTKANKYIKQMTNITGNTILSDLMEQVKYL